MSTIKTTNIQHPSAASPAVELTAAGGLWLGGGKILQVVRATDATDRTTTSTSYVDASISVTITPQKSDSALLVVWAFRPTFGSGAAICEIQITDSSNNAQSGAQQGRTQASSSVLIAYVTPATTSAVTYKGRFRTDAGNILLQNSQQTGQMYAIEVSA